MICGKSRRGKFLLWRKSRRDRLQAKLLVLKEELRRRMHQPIPDRGSGCAGGQRVVQLPCGADQHPDLSRPSGTAWSDSGCARCGGAASATRRRGNG